MTHLLRPYIKNDINSCATDRKKFFYLSSLSLSPLFHCFFPSLSFVSLFVFIFVIVCVLMTTAIVFIVELVRHCWRHFCKIYYSLRSLSYEFMLVDDRTHFVSWIPFLNKIVFKPNPSHTDRHREGSSRPLGLSYWTLGYCLATVEWSLQKSGISARELIATLKKDRKSAGGGNERSNIFPKSSQARKNPPLPLFKRKKKVGRL